MNTNVVGENVSADDSQLFRVGMLKIGGGNQKRGQNLALF